MHQHRQSKVKNSRELADNPSRYSIDKVEVASKEKLETRELLPHELKYAEKDDCSSEKSVKVKRCRDCDPKVCARNVGVFVLGIFTVVCIYLINKSAFRLLNSWVKDANFSNQMHLNICIVLTIMFAVTGAKLMISNRRDKNFSTSVGNIQVNGEKVTSMERAPSLTREDSLDKASGRMAKGLNGLKRVKCFST